MTATLIVIVFPTETRANDVFRALNAMRRRDVYNLDEALLAARSRTGVVTVSALGAYGTTGENHPVESIARRIVNQAHSDPADAPRLETSDADLDPHFAFAVASAMGNEFSALFFLIRAQSAGVATELSNVLALFHGQIARTTLTS